MNQKVSELKFLIENENHCHVTKLNRTIHHYCQCEALNKTEQ